MPSLSDKETAFIQWLRGKEQCGKPNMEYVVRVVYHQGKLAHMTQVKEGEIEKIC